MMKALPAVKEGVAAGMGAGAILGVTPADFPLFLAIAVGLLGGTMAAWARERHNGGSAGLTWFLLQAAAWLFIFVLVTALHDYPGLTVRWSGAIAALGAFASREGLNAMHKRTVDEIKERDLP